MPRCRATAVRMYQYVHVTAAVSWPPLTQQLHFHCVYSRRCKFTIFCTGVIASPRLQKKKNCVTFCHTQQFYGNRSDRSCIFHRVHSRRCTSPPCTPRTQQKMCFTTLYSSNCISTSSTDKKAVTTHVTRSSFMATAHTAAAALSPDNGTTIVASPTLTIRANTAVIICFIWW